MSHWVAFLYKESRKLLAGKNSVFENDRLPPLWMFSCDGALRWCKFELIKCNEQKTIKIRHIFTRIPEVISVSCRSLLFILSLHYWPSFPLTFHSSPEKLKRSPLKKAKKVNDHDEQKETHFICHVNHVWYLSSDLVPFNISWRFFIRKHKSERRKNYGPLSESSLCVMIHRVRSRQINFYQLHPEQTQTTRRKKQHH